MHARLAIATDQAGGVGRLEKLVRYCARPPLSNERLSMRADGRVLLELKTPWSDGTTHLAYEPLDFLAKLAATNNWPVPLAARSSAASSCASA